jgi:hypothetical protein
VIRVRTSSGKRARFRRTQWALWLLGVAATAIPTATTRAADTDATIQTLQVQIQNMQSTYQTQMQEMQRQLNALKDQQRQQGEQAEVVRQQAAQAQADVKKASSSSDRPGKFTVGGFNLQFGGYVESAGIYRSGNESADVGSNFGSGIPFGSNPNSRTSEFRQSSRQSRLSLLTTDDPDKDTKLTSYFEMDFLGAAPTANSNESNSYNLRLRQAFAEYDRADLGFSLIGGQAWSLATLDTLGLYPRREAVPLTIDAQYNVGFNWMRAPQIRFVENFAPGWYGAISFENPAALVYGGGNSVKGVLTSNPGTGGGLLNNGGSTFCNIGTSGTCGVGYTGTNFTLDVMPDIIVKTAWEPGFGHYELYGMVRDFRTEDTSASGTTVGASYFGTHPTAFGGGIGAGMVLPVVPKMIDIGGNILAGYGIGKYASGQLPDFTINPNTGAPVPIPEVEAMVGVIGHPTPSLDLYGYFGIEEAEKEAFNASGKPYGYGNSGYTNGASGASGGYSAAQGCLVGNEGGTTVINQGAYNTGGVGCNIRQLWQPQVGFWWKFYQGNWGMMELGASYSYVHVDTFSGTNGHPTTSDNIVMTSLRYYPF